MIKRKGEIKKGLPDIDVDKASKLSPTLRKEREILIKVISLKSKSGRFELATPAQ